MNHRILLAEPKTSNPEALKIFRRCGRVDIKECSRRDLIELIPKYDVLVVRLHHFIDEAVLGRASRLKCIVSATTGLDHIDLEAARRKGVRVLSLKGERRFLSRVTATAEHTWGLMLSLLRHVPRSHADVLKGRWNRDAFVGTELLGKTIGIIGYGRLGKIVARYARAFGMKILVTDPRVGRIPDHMRKVPLNRLLKESDVVSVHASLTPDTVGLIGARQFAAMKRGSVLVNTARGGIVNEGALLKALKSGRLAGAALDVLDGEATGSAGWLARHPLRTYAAQNANLILTPHLGGATVESIAKTEVFMAGKLERLLHSIR